MKERIAQLKTRWQHYSPRERTLCKLTAGVMCCAVLYYGAMTPLDNIIKNNQTALFKEKQTLNWMRDEINKNHLQAKVLKVSNPRSVVEESAKEIHLPLTELRQDGQTLSFNVEKVELDTLKNWIREMNMSSGVRMEKVELTPVDHHSEVNAHVTLSWSKTA